MLKFSKKNKNKENNALIDRRKAPDKWIYIARFLAVGGWMLFIFALVMSYYAAPDTDYGVLRYKAIATRQFWLTPLTGYLYIVLWVSAFISYLYLLIDGYRSRRTSDTKHYNHVFLLVLTITWVVYLLAHLNS